MGFHGLKSAAHLDRGPLVIAIGKPAIRTLMLSGWWFVASLQLPALASNDVPIPTERAMREECSAFSQAGMRDCLAKKVEESQAALRRAEDKVAVAISKWDEDAKYVTLARSKFAASKKQFASYRHAHCEFTASLGGGAAGNSYNIQRFACAAELNNRRAQQLLDAVSDLPSK